MGGETKINNGMPLFLIKSKMSLVAYLCWDCALHRFKGTSYHMMINVLGLCMRLWDFICMGCLMWKSLKVF